MDSQVQNLNQFAEVISADIVERLRLNSNDTVFKLVSTELSKLTDVATKLTSGIVSLDAAIKNNSAIFSKREANTTLTNEQQSSPAQAPSTINVPSKEQPKKSIIEGALEKALNFVSAPKKDAASINLGVSAGDSPKKSIMEGALEKALSFVSAPKDAVASKKSFLEGALEKALSSVSAKPNQSKVGTNEENAKQNVETSITKPVEAVSVMDAVVREKPSLKPTADADYKETIKPQETATASVSVEKESKSILQDTLQKLLEFVSSDKRKEERPNEETKTNSPTEKPQGLIQSIFDKIAVVSKLAEKNKSVDGTTTDIGAPKSELKAIEKPKEVVITGIGQQALAGLALPSFLDGFKNLHKTLQDVKNGIFKVGSNIKDLGANKAGLFESLLGGNSLKALMPLLGGAALVLGGIASLVGAFNTNSEIKGTLELIGKGGIRGGLTVIAKTLAAKGGAKLLTKIPVIGSLISLGFAIQRFSNGDIVGGMLEVGSGIASLFPGVGTVVSIGIDVLQAILDAKGGGSSAEASAKKGGILLDWAKSIGGFIDDKIQYVPVLGPLYATGKALLKGEWKTALSEFINIVPGMSWVRSLIGDENIVAAAEGAATGIGNFLKGIGEFIDEKIKYIPVLGPLYHTGKSLLKGNYKQALFEFTTLFPPLQFVRAFMDEKQVEQASENLSTSVGDWFKEIGNFIDEKIKFIPILGPLYYTGKALLKGDWKNALFEFAAILPPLQFLRSFMDEQSYQAAAKGVVVNVKDWITSIQDWIYEKASNLPVIGPLIAAIENLIDDPIGVLEVLPGGKSLVSFFKFITSGKVVETSLQFTGNIIGKVVDWVSEKVQSIPVIGPLIKAISSAISDPVSLIEQLPGGKSIVELFKSGNIVGGVVKLAGNVLDKAVDWVSEKVQNIPVIGPLIKIFSSAINDPIEFLKALPGGGAIIAFLEGAKNLASSAIDTVGNFASSLSEKVKNLFTSILDSIMNGFLNLIPEKVSVFGVDVDIRNRVASFLGIKSATPSPSTSAAPASSGGAPESSPVKQVQDSAIDPKGGLIISSPNLGALYQVNKQDGIVSGPIMEDNRGGIKSSSQENQNSESSLKNLLFNKSDSSKSDSILERIANNTASSNQNISNLIVGFNNLAKALEKTLGETASIPMVANITNNQDQAQKPTSSQYANAGNSDIANFRTNFIEGARFRPA